MAKKGTVRTLWRVMEGQRLRYGAAILAILISAVFAAGRPMIFARTIGHVIGGKVLDAPGWVKALVQQIGGRSVLAQNLWICALAAVTVTLLSGLFSYLKGRWSARSAETIARRLRNRLYDHLQRLPCRYHDEHKTGDLIQRCTSDVETLRLFLAMHVVEIGRMAILIALVVPLMLREHIWMGLLSTMAVPLIITFAVIFFVRIKSRFKAQDEAEGKMTALLQENITGIRVVRAFARGEHESEKFARANADYRDRWHGLMKLFSWYWSCSDVLCISQDGVVLLCGCWFAMRGELGIDQVYLFMAYLHLFLWPVRHAARLLADLGKAQVAIGRIGEILDAPEEADTPVAASKSELPAAAGRIEFDGLSFSHTAEIPVLRDVSFTVEAGQTLAILGPSGSGKSTLINLLLRLYDYSEGSIRLDGVELRDLPRAHVRNQIGVVLQEPFLFSKTLRENIRLGRAAAPDEQIAEAASLASVHENIQGFEKGYDTLVGERGVTLSGGQRQRVALARALLRKPPILVLDDALSAVDTQTEVSILRALRERHGLRTTLAIAHRLTTLMHADRIIVLEDGRIVQSGTHASLVAEDGMYRRLWRIQSSLEKDLSEEMAAGGGTS